MTNADLAELNARQQAAGLKLYANTRNSAAGSIRLLDPRICAERRLRFFAHGVGYIEGLPTNSHWEFLQLIGGWGVPPTPLAKRFDNFAAAVEHCQSVIGRLHEFDFEVDGLVLKVDRFDQRERLGATSKAPRWLVAYKFEKYEAMTRVQRHLHHRGQERRADADRRSGAGANRRHDGEPRGPAQRRRDRPQGRSHRRHDRRGKGRQDHSARRPRGEASAAGTMPASSCIPRTARSAARSWRRTKAASTSAARTFLARRSSASGCCISPADRRWTSRAWVRSWPTSSSKAGSCTTSAICTT